MNYEAKRNVEISMIAPDGRLSLVGHFNIIQDAITKLLHINKLGAPVLRNEYNSIWLFAKTKVKFIKRLHCHDDFTVRAFFSRISLAQMHVDVQIKTADGETATYARTVICAFDLEKQSIRRLGTVGVDPKIAAVSEENIEFSGFDDANPQLTDSIKVRSTNIDLSYHTNNVEYIRLIMNTYTVAQTEAMNITEMELHYTGQSFENDTLSIRKAVKDNEHIAIVEKDGNAVMKCKITCKKIVCR